MERATEVFVLAKVSVKTIKVRTSEQLQQHALIDEHRLIRSSSIKHGAWKGTATVRIPSCCPCGIPRPWRYLH